MQQQKLWRIGRTRLAIGNLETIDVGRAVLGRRHQSLLCLELMNQSGYRAKNDNLPVAACKG
jgi:hypothetical protein